MGPWPVRYLGSAVKQKLIQRVQALPVCITLPLVLSHSDFCSWLVVAEICFLSLSLLFFSNESRSFWPSYVSGALFYKCYSIWLACIPLQFITTHQIQ